MIFLSRALSYDKRPLRIFKYEMKNSSLLLKVSIKRVEGLLLIFG